MDNVDVMMPNDPLKMLPSRFGDLHDSTHKGPVIVQNSAQTREITVTASSHDSASTSFNHDLSDSVVLDRTVFLRSEIKCRITASGNNRPIVVADFYKLCLQQLPLHRIMKTLNVTINGTSKAISPTIFINALAKYQDGMDFRRIQSLTPIQPDSHSTVALMSALGMSAGAGAGTIPPESPFAGYQGDELARNRFKYAATEVTPSGASATNVYDLVWTVTEPLYHPFFVNSDHEETLARVKNMQVDITWANLAGAFTYHNAGAENQIEDGTAACTLTFDFTTTKAKLLLRTLQPTIAIPPVVQHRFTDIAAPKSYNFTFPAAQTGQTTTVSTGSITFPIVPNRIYLFARQLADYSATTQANSYCAIDSVTARTDADQGGLAGATSQQLFEMSSRNGLYQTYEQFSYDQGSVVCISVENSDLAGFVAGARVPFVIDFTVGLRNVEYTDVTANSGGRLVNKADAQNALTTNWSLYIIATYPSMMELDGSNMLVFNGSSVESIMSVLENANPFGVLNSKSGSGVHVGGNFFRDVARGFSKGFNGALNTVGKVADIGSKVAPLVLLGAGGQNQKGKGIRTLG